MVRSKANTRFGSVGARALFFTVCGNNFLTRTASAMENEPFHQNRSHRTVVTNYSDESDPVVSRVRIDPFDLVLSPTTEPLSRGDEDTIRLILEDLIDSYAEQRQLPNGITYDFMNLSFQGAGGQYFSRDLKTVLAFKAGTASFLKDQGMQPPNATVVSSWVEIVVRDRLVLALDGTPLHHITRAEFHSPMSEAPLDPRQPISEPGQAATLSPTAAPTDPLGPRQPVASPGQTVTSSPTMPPTSHTVTSSPTMPPARQPTVSPTDALFQPREPVGTPGTQSPSVAMTPELPVLQGAAQQETIGGSQSNKKGSIAGATVGVLAAFCILAAVLLVRRRRRLRNNNHVEDDPFFIDEYLTREAPRPEYPGLDSNEMNAPSVDARYAGDESVASGSVWTSSSSITGKSMDTRPSLASPIGQTESFEIDRQVMLRKDILYTSPSWTNASPSRHKEKGSALKPSYFSAHSENTRRASEAFGSADEDDGGGNGMVHKASLLFEANGDEKEVYLMPPNVETDSPTGGHLV